MSTTRIVTSLVTIGVASALLIGATFAFFSDTSTSNNNKFTSGVLNLEVKDDDEGFQNSVVASTVSPTNWAPGESFESYICFKNAGTIDFEEIIFKMTASSGTPLRPFVIAEKVELGSATESDCTTFAGGTMFDFTTLFIGRFASEITADGKVTLDELLADVDGTDRIEDDLLNGVAKLTPGDIMKFRTTWKFDTAATNAAQGKTVTVNTTFTANQDESP